MPDPDQKPVNNSGTNLGAVSSASTPDSAGTPPPTFVTTPVKPNTKSDNETVTAVPTVPTTPSPPPVSPIEPFSVPASSSTSNQAGAPESYTIGNNKPAEVVAPSTMATLIPPGSPPKKKNKVLLAIIGVLVLITGLTAGLILVQQPQDIRQRAQVYPSSSPGGQCPGAGPNNCAIYECPSGCLDLGGGQPECRTFVRYADCSTLTAQSVSNCGQIDYLNGDGTQGGAYCGVLPGSQCRNNLTACSAPPPPPPGPPPPPPPPPPGFSAQCDAVSVYAVNGDITNPASWTLLTNSQLQSLQVGNTVYITTRGTVTNGQITKARIRVNSSTWTTGNETSSIKPKANSTDPDEYYVAYTIPAGTTTFTFESEVYESTQNKWY